MKKNELLDLFRKRITDILDIFADSIENRSTAKIINSELAAKALCMIACHESKLMQYWRQLDDGPAIGPFQMEPQAIDDVRRYLGERPDLADAIKSGLFGYGTDDFTASNAMFDFNMMVIAARLYLFKFPESLPENERELSAYLKKHWNTDAGWAESDSYFIDYHEFASDMNF